jgi:hypothetical protein
MRHVTKALIYISIIVFYNACSKEGGNSLADSGSAGKGGSLARFTISGNYLYLADLSTIEVYDISNPSNPVDKGSVSVGFGVETIFPYKDKLFIGSSDGMFIYSLAKPAQPALLGKALHVRTCDPVVANDTTAYVTLRGSGRCGAAQDALYVYDVSSITTPVEKAVLPLSTPYGLGLCDTVVFVCRSLNGLTAVNVTKPSAPKEMYTMKDGNYLDIIPLDQFLLCYMTNGLTIYDKSNLNKLEKISDLMY